MLPRGCILIGAILALGGMIGWAIPGALNGLPFWVAYGSLVILAAVAFRKPSAGGGGLKNRWLAPGEFLCDACKYNHPSACSRPERPNARRCPDYRQR